MTSVQAECSSTRLFDEPHSNSHMPETHSHGASTILEQLGGRFSADVAHLLQQAQHEPLSSPHTEAKHELTEVQQFALARIRANNIQGAVTFIQRHAPEQMDWLQAQIRVYASAASRKIEAHTPTNDECQETTIYQRLIWQESQSEFVAASTFHRFVLEDHNQYMGLFG